tara:strand:- start:166 stop:306 length:141 start_codon:yes stop_codon:yes gene_type:complete
LASKKCPLGAKNPIFSKAIPTRLTNAFFDLDRLKEILLSLLLEFFA